MGTGPIDCDLICKYPLSQLAHHSRIKGHFVTILIQFIITVALCEQALDAIMTSAHKIGEHMSYCRFNNMLVMDFYVVLHPECAA